MEEALVEVVVPENEDYAETGLIYAPWLLAQTQQLLPKTVRIPQDVRCVLETVYRQPDDIPQAWAEMMFSEQRMQAQAGGNMLPPARSAPLFRLGRSRRALFPWRSRRKEPPPERGWATVRRALRSCPRRRLRSCSPRRSITRWRVWHLKTALPSANPCPQAKSRSLRGRAKACAGACGSFPKNGCRCGWAERSSTMTAPLGALTERVRCD